MKHTKEGQSWECKEGDKSCILEDKIEYVKINNKL